MLFEKYLNMNRLNMNIKKNPFLVRFVHSYDFNGDRAKWVCLGTKPRILVFKLLSLPSIKFIIINLYANKFLAQLKIDDFPIFLQVPRLKNSPIPLNHSSQSSLIFHYCLYFLKILRILYPHLPLFSQIGREIHEIRSALIRDNQCQTLLMVFLFILFYI